MYSLVIVALCAVIILKWRSINAFCMYVYVCMYETLKLVGLLNKVKKKGCLGVLHRRPNF